MAGGLLGSICHDCTVRLWDIAYLKELRHMERNAGGEDEDEDDSDDDPDEVEKAVAAADAEGGAADEEDDESEEEVAAAPPPRKKMKALKSGHAAIKMGADFFSDM